METLFYKAKKCGASDLHLSSGSPPKIRLDGILNDLSDEILMEDFLERHIKNFLSKEDWERFLKQKQWEGALSHELFGRVRATLFRHANGEGGVFRFLPEELTSFENLNLPSVLKNLALYSQGLVLITGATGSGKSTTLSALIDHINLHKKSHIVTIEDPIEIIFKNKKSLIHQRELGRHTKNFDQALSNLLRSDPDVIVLGEIRDLVGMRFALSAAETGHLVLSTLHANSAPKALHRMIDLFQGYEKSFVCSQLAEVLLGICAQRLLPKIAGGRIVGCEVLLANAAIRNLIRDEKIAQIETIMQTHKNLGMQTMDQDLRRLVDNQIVERAILTAGAGMAESWGMYNNSI